MFGGRRVPATPRRPARDHVDHTAGSSSIGAAGCSPPCFGAAGCSPPGIGAAGRCSAPIGTAGRPSMARPRVARVATASRCLVLFGSHRAGHIALATGRFATPGVGTGITIIIRITLASPTSCAARHVTLSARKEDAGSGKEAAESRRSRAVRTTSTGDGHVKGAGCSHSAFAQEGSSIESTER